MPRMDKKEKFEDAEYDPTLVPKVSKKGQPLEVRSKEEMQARFEELLEKIRNYADKRLTGASHMSPSKKKTRGRARQSGEGDESTEDLESPQFIRLTQSPMYIEKTELHQYQLEGLNWLLRAYHRGINCILADEMGLGKTIQTIALLGFIKQYRDNKKPHIIIVPKSVMRNWVKEIKKWCPLLKPFLFHGDKEHREKLMETELYGGKWDILLTSYEMAIIEQEALNKIDYHYLIIDEAHRIKNENSVLSTVVRLFSADHRLLITGTPLQNNLHELWALLNYLLPEIFTRSDDFDDWFNVNKGESQGNIMSQLHKIMKPFMLRRLKKDVKTSFKTINTPTLYRSTF